MIIVASVLGLILASAMWWAYFDVSALLGEHALASEPVETRRASPAMPTPCAPAARGRHPLSGLWVEGSAVVRQRQQSPQLTDPLPSVALAALVGGVIIYLLGHVIFKWLTVHTISVVRLAAACPALGTSIDRAATGSGSAGRRGIPCDVRSGG